MVKALTVEICANWVYGWLEVTVVSAALGKLMSGIFEEGSSAFMILSGQSIQCECII